jgi:uncharacterized protein involved in exopolysaccharide biosynthesis
MPEDLKLALAPPAPSPTMRDLLAVVFRHRSAVLLTFVVTFVAITAYGFLAPSYQSEMRVILRRGRIDPVVTPTPSQGEFERLAVTEEEVNSEAELLQDDEILRTVVRDVGLLSEGRSWFWDLAGDDDDRRLARAVRRVGKRLTVEPVHKAALIGVSYESSNPGQAAKVLRSLAGAYLERHHQLHRPSGEFKFFDQQVTQARRGLESAELRLIDFMRDRGVVSATQERDAAVLRLSDAEAERRQTQVAIATNRERVRSLQAQLATLPPRVMTQIRNADNPQLMERMKGRLLELQLKRTELLTQYDPAYRLVQEVVQEIAEAKAAIAGEEQAPIRDQTSDLDPDHAWATSELLKAQVEESSLIAHGEAENTVLAYYHGLASVLGNSAIEQEHLQHDLKGAEERYLLYVNKKEEARIGDALDQGGILNVAIAEQPTIPALPKISGVAFMLIGVFVAGTLSLGQAFLTDYLAPSFRTPDEIVALLGLPVLASLPRGNVLDMKIRTGGTDEHFR